VLQSFPEISVIVEDELYSLPFSKPDCSLLIDLPEGFPESSEAILLVEPVIEHSWILANGQVKMPVTMNGQTLAARLKELKKELAGPPVSFGYSSGGANYSDDFLMTTARGNIATTGNTGPIQAPVQPQAQMHYSQPTHQQTTHQQIPALSINQQQKQQQHSSSLPTSPVHRHLLEDDLFLINQLDLEQIEALLKDESSFSAFLGTLDTFRALDSDVIQAENYKLSGKAKIEKAGANLILIQNRTKFKRKGGNGRFSQGIGRST
jgi:hypothetical protein